MSVIAYHFWSPTCGPCKHIKPAIDDLKDEFRDVQWVSVNTHDDDDGYAKKFNVSVVPTIVVLAKDVNGKHLMVDKNSGTTMSTYYRSIRAALRMTGFMN